MLRILFFLLNIGQTRNNTTDKRGGIERDTSTSGQQIGSHSPSRKFFVIRLILFLALTLTPGKKKKVFFDLGCYRGSVLALYFFVRGPPFLFIFPFSLLFHPYTLSLPFFFSSFFIHSFIHPHSLLLFDPTLLFFFVFATALSLSITLITFFTLLHSFIHSADNSLTCHISFITPFISCPLTLFFRTTTHHKEKQIPLFY